MYIIWTAHCLWDVPVRCTNIKYKPVQTKPGILEWYVVNASEPLADTKDKREKIVKIATFGSYDADYM